MAEKMLEELNAEKRFECASYNQAGLRFKMFYEDTQDRPIEKRELQLDKDDVVLVTGGAKGITAECALAFALKFNCQMALVGSSLLNEEIQTTLKKYSANGLTARYYSCNVSDSEAVERLIAQITDEMGAITTVIHGAGLNIPRKAETVTAEEALKEISPKLFGALNIIQSLNLSHLECFIALTSIIGITGMPGNAWYAFSNEALDLTMRNLKLSSGVETISFAFSVWDELGMGARMGSTKGLAKMGIGAINPEHGIEEFLRWLDMKTDDQQIVVSAALGGLDTWPVKSQNKYSAGRYIEEIIHLEEGKQLIVRATLNPKDDLYLNDHNFNGSLLFPTVFGMEAMTQAAAHLTGVVNLTSIRFENISLLRPIVVPNDGELQIQIQATAKNQANGELKVFASISTEESDFQIAHFSAEIILNPFLSTRS